MTGADEMTSNETGIVIGLDIGGSTTKIIGLHEGRLIGREWVRANDPVASAYGAVGKFISQNRLGIRDIARIRVTGVGASHLSGDLLDVPTVKTPEFKAIGLGGLYVADAPEAIVVSMGTGTAIVLARADLVSHIIGSGVGGGTLLGLAGKMLNVRDFSLFNELAGSGDLGHIDLTIGDITRDEIPGLSPDTTASNFGKVSDSASQEDIALGIVNLIFQSVGTAAVLSARLNDVQRIIITGNLTRIRSGKAVFQRFADLYGVRIDVPDGAEYATAIGAALCPS